MAASQSQTPCPDCDCSDSPLSVTGNILGILTFAVAVYTSLFYYCRGLRTSEAEQTDMLHKVALAMDDLRRVGWKHGQDADKIRDDSARRRLDEAFQRAQSCADEARRLLIRRDAHTPASSSLVRILEAYSFRDRAAYVLEKERIVQALGRMETSTRDLKEVASDVFGQIPAETDGRVMSTVPVLEEIMKQNSGLRLVMEEVMLRVSALENRPRGWRTEPRAGEQH